MAGAVQQRKYSVFQFPLDLVFLNYLNLLVLTFISFFCRNTGDDDVAIKVLYCGICHSDLHTIKNEWRNANYPVVPG
jgi:hypothetical protein